MYTEAPAERRSKGLAVFNMDNAVFETLDAQVQFHVSGSLDSTCLLQVLPFEFPGNELQECEWMPSGGIFELTPVLAAEATEC